MILIKRISIQGWRSIKEISSYEPGKINVLIGANGAGKSNLVSFFKFLRQILSPVGHLQSYISENGHASANLHYGPDVTKIISSEIVLSTDIGLNYYRFALKYVKPDKLIFANEGYKFENFGEDEQYLECGSTGQEEANIVKVGNDFTKAITQFINNITIFQFHNTGDTAGMRNNSHINNGSYLRSNGENIASVLYNLSINHVAHYVRLVNTLRLVFPFFDDFVFYNDSDYFLLKWKESGQKYELNASQASDGMLRTICLFTLLMQPQKKLPQVILIDEPELGLHPVAINLLMGVIQEASINRQIFICTQSPQIVDQSDFNDIVVLNREYGHTSLYKPKENEFKDWLDTYTNSQIWEKNLIGGRP